MSNLFVSIYQFFKGRRGILYLLVITLFIVMGWVTSHITLEEDITSFLPQTPETAKANFILKNLGTNDKIIIQLSVQDTAIENEQDFLAAWADSLADSLNINPGKEYIREIFYKIDESQILNTYDQVLENIPLYLNENDYHWLDSMVTADNIQKVLNKTKEDLISPMGMIYRKFLLADPFKVSGRVFKSLQQNAVDSLYQVYNGNIFTKDNKHLLLFISTTHGIGETGKNQVLAEALDKQLLQVVERSKGKIKYTSFGAVLVGVSNASQIKKDSWISSIFSLVLILILLLVFFRNGRSMVLLVIPVVFGVLFALTIIYFLKGSISAIAVGAGSAIIGIAINYTLHFLVHHKHSKSVEQTVKDLVTPLLIGSITTIGAFLSLMFVSSDALHDFGIFAGLALTGTILFVLIFMPHFIKNTRITSYPVFFDTLSEMQPDRNKWVILGIFILTLVFGYFSGKLSFESDMNKISYMTDQQKEAFQELSSFTNIAQQSFILVAEGKDDNEALQHYESARHKIDSLSSIHRISAISGVADFLMSDSVQDLRIRKWETFWSSRKSIVQHNFKQAAELSGFQPGTFDHFLSLTQKKYSLKQIPELESCARFTSNYVIRKDGKCFIITLVYPGAGYEKEVKSILGGVKGNFIFSRSQVTRDIIKILSNDFNVILFFCALLVLVFLTITFGRLELSLLTFIPMVIAWIWILGLMAIFQVKFNIVNIILATFIFGLGDDYSIFIMEGSMNEHAYRRKILGSYKLAVILSALTMFIGIGSLIFARHPAMKSLAQVTIIGMISVVIVSYTILPYFYRWLTTKKGVRREMPRTFRNIFNSVYSFTAFLVGSIILSLIGLWLFKITRSNDRKKLYFHKCLAFAAKFVVYRIPQVKTKLINTIGEDFSKPAVIISNHQSHIDLMLIMMLSPKIIILTNEWVWNSPFYGSIVKWADFYPVANGIEKSLEPLSRMVEKGYSIMVFPEGTRSADCSINRFHKGAFFLAEQLNLDILPVLIHGIGHILPKTDFLLRKGKLTVKILPRIKPEDKNYGETYSHRAKYVRRLFREEYTQLAASLQTPSYYADKVFHNYIYKGAAISLRATLDLRKHRDYSEIISHCPVNGRVLIYGNGMGICSLLLSMVRPQIHIDNVEADEDDYLLALHCASRGPQINSFNISPLDHEIGAHYDAILILDHLSGLVESDKMKLLQKCLQFSNKIIISDIPYSRFQKFRLQLVGTNLVDHDTLDLNFYKRLKDEFQVDITATDAKTLIISPI